MRTERDALGEKDVPDEVYWGIQTQRAIENFHISGLRFPPEMVHAIGAVKAAAAWANTNLGVLKHELGEPIELAATEVMHGKWDDQFVLDVFQAGAGTSFHMNANEVIANRALEMLGLPKGSYDTISPNDHVNMSQSTNDVFPSVIRVAAMGMIRSRLLPALQTIIDALDAKSKEFHNVVKAGRTHLQDAVPVRLGQEFGGYVAALRSAYDAIHASTHWLGRINLGATATGTGLNAPAGYQDMVVPRLGEITTLELDLRPAENLFEVTQSAADFARVSSGLRTLALELIRVTNDLRLLSSGPNTGFGEIKLPAVQPGSSIMPGKVNPSIAEMVDMVGFQVVGNDAVIAMGVQAGQLELNVMGPVIAHNLLQSIDILASASEVFANKCVSGITVNRETAQSHAERTPSVVTALAPRIGYLTAAEIAKESSASGKSIREIVLERQLVGEEELDDLLDLRKMTGE